MKEERGKTGLAPLPRMYLSFVFLLSFFGTAFTFLMVYGEKESWEASL